MGRFNKYLLDVNVRLYYYFKSTFKTSEFQTAIYYPHCILEASVADFTVIIHCYLTLVLLLPNAPEDGICVYCKRKVTKLSKSLLLSEKPLVQASFLCRPPFSPKVRCKFSMHAHNVSYCKSIAWLFTTTGPGMGILFHRRIAPVLFILLYHFIYLHTIYIYLFNI